MKKINIFLVLGLLAALFATALNQGSARAAGSATLTLSPTSGSYQVGKTFKVSVYENSGSEEVNAVSAKLSYTASQLECVSASFNGAFGIAASQTCGGGSVNLEGGSGTPLTGSKKVGEVTFKVRVGSGSTAVRTAAGSQIVSSDSSEDIWNGSTTSARFSLTTPSSSGGGSSPSSPDSPSSSSDPDEEPTAPATPSGDDETPQPTASDDPKNAEDAGDTQGQSAEAQTEPKAPSYWQVSLSFKIPKWSVFLLGGLAVLAAGLMAAVKFLGLNFPKFWTKKTPPMPPEPPTFPPAG